MKFICPSSSADRALPCGGRGQRFKSSLGRHKDKENRFGGSLFLLSTHPRARSSDKNVFALSWTRAVSSTLLGISDQNRTICLFGCHVPVTVGRLLPAAPHVVCGIDVNMAIDCVSTVSESCLSKIVVCSCIPFAIAFRPADPRFDDSVLLGSTIDRERIGTFPMQMKLESTNL